MSVTINGSSNSIIFPGTTSGQVTLSATAATTGTQIQYLPDLAGTLLISTQPLNFPSTSGNAGDVLTTDGAGVLSWGPNTAGSVTSVNVSGGTSGLVFTGGAITSSGTITITSGVLTEAYGGTGWATLGTGVQAALGVATNSALGLAKLNGSGALAVAQGGTGATSAAVAANNLLPAQSAPQAGYVLSTDGAGTLSWVSNSALLSVGTPISGGTANTLLIEDNSNNLAEIVMGSGVQAALAVGTNAANGFMVADASGVLDPAQGGTGLSALGSGVQTALGNPANGNSGLAVLNGSGILAVAQGGTGISALGAGVATFLGAPTSANLAAAVGDDTGSGALVFATSPVLTTPNIGTPSAGVLTSCTGLPISTGLTGAGTGVLGALANNVGTAGSIVVNGGALGTPTSGDLSSCTNLDLTTGVGTSVLPIANGGTALAAAGASGTTLVSDGANLAYGYPDRAVSLSGGNAGEIPYQSATNTTSFLSAGTVGYVLSSNAAAAPSWLENKIYIGGDTITLGNTTPQLTLSGLTTVTLTQDPTSGLEAATKQYVDAITSPIARLAPVDAATTGNITLSGPQTIDGVAVVAGDRVLVKNQTTSSDNGVYDVQAAGWTRSVDADQAVELNAASVFVLSGGTVNGATSWIQTLPITAFTDPQTWTIQSALAPYVGGTGINVTGYTISNTGVTSLADGGVGLTFSASTGSVTLGGTLGIGNGGTGITSFGTGVQGALGIATGAAGGMVLAGASPVTDHGVVIGGLGGVLNSTAVGSAGQIFTSGGAGVDPTWTTATYPSTTTANQLLYSSAANTVTGLATVNGGILNTSATGVPSVTAAPTIGVPGTTAGSIALAGSGSGSVTLQPASAAASGTVTIPNGPATLLASTAALTGGSVLFANASGVISEDNTKFFFNDATDQLIIGANTPIVSPTNLQLVVTKDALINGMTVGLGTAQVAGNTVVGDAAMVSNASGADNVAVGKDALTTNTAGSSNVAIGVNALGNLTNGSNNIAIGLDSGTDALGNITTGSNQIILGNVSHTQAYVQASWTVVSDIRDKNIEGEVPHGLDFVEKLNTIRYRFKENRDSNVSHGPTRYGFSAQQILEVEGSDNVIVDTSDENKLKFTEASLIPVLVNAIKELSSKNKSLEERLAALETK